MSFKAFFQSILRCEWLGEAEAAVDRFVRSVVPKVLRWRWRVAGLAGVLALFLVPFSIFALTPQEQNILAQHEFLENSALSQHQSHEKSDLVEFPGVSASQLQQHQQQELQTLRAHEAQLQALPDRSLILNPSLIPLQMSLEQQQLRKLLAAQHDEIVDAQREGRSRRFIQLLRQRHLTELLILFKHLQDVYHSSPNVLTDLDVFDPPIFQFFPPGRHRDLDGDFDGDDPNGDLDNDFFPVITQRKARG